MAFTQTDVETLERAIASGQQSVQFGDRRVSYQTLGDMRDALREMRVEVAAASGAPPRKRVFRAYQSGTGY